MAAESSPAETARKLGNERYKEGKFGAAIALYTKAATLAPQDPLPISNLSSVKFEQGQYDDAVAFIHKSLELTDKAKPDDKVTSRKEALYKRLAKCYLAQAKFDELQDILDEISDKQLKDSILATLQSVKAWEPARKDLNNHRKNALYRLPTLRASVIGAGEYAPVGHDSAESLFDDELLRTCSARDDVALMFCGSGDARNIFTTIALLSADELGKNVKRCRNLHITMLDVKPAAIARSLLFLHMAIEHTGLAQAQPQVVSTQDASVIMAYLFLGNVIPPVAAEHLRRNIDGLLQALVTDVPLLTGQTFMSSATRKAVIRILQQWQKPPDVSYYRPAAIRAASKKHINDVRDYKVMQGVYVGDYPAFRDFNADQQSLERTGVVLPPQWFAQRHDPRLFKLQKQKNNDVAVCQHIDATWATNWTMIDFDYIDTKAEEDKTPHAERDVREIAAEIPDFTGKGLGALERIGIFFQTFSMALTHISKRLTLEVIVGEMTETMDRIRWGCLEDRSKERGKDAIDPSNFPRLYDRIHMSNVPDYVGGLLSVAIFARPLLREDRQSSLTFNCLLNSPAFATHEEFQAEYLLMYSMKTISDHFSMVRVEDSPRVRMLSGGDFKKLDYLVWKSIPTKKLVHGTNMLPRPALEKWVYAHFLKTCLPYPRDRHGKIVYSPLTFHAFIGLVVRLAEIGYPIHWLSDILSAICSGTITTNARTPDNEVTTPADIDKKSDQHKLNVSPWKDEFTTVLSVWSPLLPFGFSPPPGSLPEPGEIAEFEVAFSNVDASYPQVPHFVLAFWKLDNVVVRTCSGWLTYHVYGLKFPTAQLVNQRARFVSGKYAHATRTISFWLRADVVEQMKDEGWKAYLWRVDSWEPVSEGVGVKEGVVKKRTWDE